MIFLLLVVTASFSPAAPTIGDAITLEFDQPVVLEPSEAFEILSQKGNSVVIRTFRPAPVELSGRIGNVKFQKLIIPVTSVLQPDDNLQPAPLKPPAPSPASLVPIRAIGAAALAAVIAWLAVYLLARRTERAAIGLPELPAADRFRLSVAELRSEPSRGDRWAALADATRRYLAATELTVGIEMTTAEMSRAIALTNLRPQDVIVTILRQGDLEKFSPWGARPGDFDALAERALELIPAPPVEVAA